MTVDSQDIPSTERLDVSGLQSLLRRSEPATVLVPRWLMNAFIAHALEMIPGSIWVPDEQIFVTGRDRFQQFINDQELPLIADLPAQPWLILLERPDESSNSFAETPALLLRYWRLLVRASVERHLRIALGDSPEANRVPEAKLPTSLRQAIDERVDLIGHVVFNEARHVLTREKRIGAGANDLESYVKFAAALIDVKSFAPNLLSHVLPTAGDGEALLAVLYRDLPVDLVERLRPEGAALPAAGYQPLDLRQARLPWHQRITQWFTGDSEASRRKSIERLAKDRKSSLLAKADKSELRGNDVGAALLRASAYCGERSDLWFVPGAANKSVDRLAKRLAAALGDHGGTAEDWAEALRPLLGPAKLGWWTAEARLLYDLQKVCVDHEREIYNTNLVQWLLELARRPLYRPLPLQKPALVARHLRTAEHRLARCRLQHDDRARLEHLFHEAVRSTEVQLRKALSPGIVQAFDVVGMKPRNSVESVAQTKIADEMVDQVIRHGHLSFAGLRDTISRNVLRCEDLQNPLQLVGYDQLMKLDRELGREMDGVYRRGETYRYVFQKVSSLLFATTISRFFTRLLIMPLIGAIVLVGGFQFIVLHLLHAITGVSIHIFPERVADIDSIDDWPKMLAAIIMAGFLSLVINWPAFRRGTARTFKFVFRHLGWLVFELPRQLLRTSPVRWLLASRGVRAVFRYGVKPGLLALIAWRLLPHTVSDLIDALTFALVFIAANLLLNNRRGRALEQEALHALRVGSVRITVDLVGYAFRGILHFFERILEAIDRMLYAVDEWLRFRSGQNSSSRLLKTAIGVVWFYLDYLFRFAVNLLVEPQVNPIKHFPVVTVSHKLLLPLAVPQAHAPSPFGGALMWLFPAMTRTAADTTAATVVWGIPGIFGFLAWELKENWKLYRANLPLGVRPVHFGSHGESIAQLLRPGFHSGTLPKAYAKLRKAHRLAGQQQQAEEGMEFPLAVHKPLEAIHHVEEDVRKFVERAFLRQLNQHPAFAASPLELSELALNVTSIQLRLSDVSERDRSIVILFQQVHGWIVAELTDHGWLARLGEEQASLFANALRGFYKMSAIDIVREGVDRLFAGRGLRWTLHSKTLEVRSTSTDGTAPAAVYWLHEQIMQPETIDGEIAHGLPVLEEQQVLLRSVEVPWEDWVALWQPAAVSSR